MFVFNFCLDINHRKASETNYNDDYLNNVEETMKDCSPNLSTGNGDIRLFSLPNKRPRHSHPHPRSRRVVPPIVLIPQQSHPLSSSSIVTNPHSQNPLVNSNMFLLEKHLKYLMNKQKQEEDRNEIINEWKLMALIMDRLLFWLFTFFTVFSTVVCLTIIPLLKNAGYISALANELLSDFKSTEAIEKVIQGQLMANGTILSTPNK